MRKMIGLLMAAAGRGAAHALIVLKPGTAWPSATGRELFAARSAFLNAVRAAAKGL